MNANNKKIVLAGGNGFLGSLLQNWFTQKGWIVVVLSRTPSRGSVGVKQVYWDGRTCGSWCEELEGAGVLINLAGRSVNCRYHARNRREMMMSRVESTRVLGEAIGRCAEPPAVWLNSSTATLYKHALHRAMDESGETGATPEAKDAFSIEVAQAWEDVFRKASAPRTRKVLLRTAMVFAVRDGTVFRVLRRLVRAGLGGRMGSGRQFVSWIHEHDFCRAIDWLIDQDGFSDAVNVASPNPLTNSDMMRIFRDICGRSFGLPASEWMLEVGAFFLRTETELIIKSRRVVPGRLLQSGFVFKYPDMADALRQIERRVRH